MILFDSIVKISKNFLERLYAKSCAFAGFEYLKPVKMLLSA